jgi:hypothetical protein
MATLRVSEAVELAHALVARLAEIEDIRILFVKGPTAVQLGARPARPSSDVDVLCEPGGMERLGAALECCGWRRRVPDSANKHFVHAARYLFEHSVHYIHDNWPCDLDVHYNFPGFFAPDDVVFETLWQRRTTTEVAHWPVPCADLLGQAAIVGLHALRDPGVARNEADLDQVTGALGSLDADSLAELSSFAAATGCSETLQPLLERVEAPVLRSQWGEHEALRRWDIRTRHARTPTSSWLIELRHTPWSRRPAVVKRALLLPADELLSSHIGLEPTRRNVLRLQAQRWVRAVRHLRGGLRAARRSERDLDEA